MVSEKQIEVALARLQEARPLLADWSPLDERSYRAGYQEALSDALLGERTVLPWPWHTNETPAK